ncbi:MAG: phosphoribosylamine--glycine ligase [Deltaproteobacteria bacterium]
MGKKLLVVGQGGREHALVWKLAQSPKIEKIYAAPGNPGIAQLAECVNISIDDTAGLLDFARQEKIDLTVVGPEAPLMDGIVDQFTAAGLKIFGPSAAAARLEGSKVFTKQLLHKYGIPTARFEVCENSHSAHIAARSYIDRDRPVVLKADGLAAGKGVVVTADSREAADAIEAMMNQHTFGQAGDRIVVEECLAGEELSVFTLCDGKNYLTLMTAQDHKRIFDNDEGPNTGGMGAYVNPPVYTPELKAVIENKIVAPVITAMQKEGHPYRGVLYTGLMLTADGPQVLEFNARFGDPETQVLMPAIKDDLFPLLEACADGTLGGGQVELEANACVGVVLASGGYPGDYPKGKTIEGLDQLAEDTMVFHAGTAIKDGQLVTNGGRVMAVVCRGKDNAEAIGKVYKEVEKIHFEGMHYRRDIGRRALHK